MANKSKIRFEWDGDHASRLWAIRDKGRITMPELKEALSKSFAGRIFTITFAVHEEYDMFDWDGTEPEGDVWELYEVIDGDPCPICNQISPPQYCSECGAYMFPQSELGRKA